MLRAIAAAGFILGLAIPAAGQDSPSPWRDPSTGCVYLLAPGGGITPRLQADGTPDCPDAVKSAATGSTPPALSEGGLRRFLDQLRDLLDGARREPSPPETPQRQ